MAPRAYSYYRWLEDRTYDLAKGPMGSFGGNGGYGVPETRTVPSRMPPRLPRPRYIVGSINTGDLFNALWKSLASPYQRKIVTRLRKAQPTTRPKTTASRFVLAWDVPCEGQGCRVLWKDEQDS